MADQSGAEISAGGISQLEQSFQYSPLDPSVDGIRLLILEPGAKGEIPTCTLRHVTFRQRPKYEALSYTWGDETQRQNILLEGHSVSVTKNLYNALCGLRRTSEPRQLWADAICINQEDIPERNRQLPLMPFVYERAQIVLIWLGLCEMESARDSERASSVDEKAQSLLDWLRLSSNSSGSFRRSLKPGGLNLATLPASVAALLLPGVTEVLLAGLELLFIEYC
ncbi:hypothetical protein ACMFMG_009476 [Clarireedia jacksonii]